MLNLDRWRESRKWLPAWLDNTDPKTWFWHGVLTLFGGCLVGFVPFGIGVPFHWSMRAGWCAAVVWYAVREYKNVRELVDEGKPLKPLDHVLDVVSPLVACVLAWRFLT